MKRSLVTAALLLAACSSPPGSSSTGTDLATPSAPSVVINEVFPFGTGPNAPDWIELANVTMQAVSLAGYQVRDKPAADLYALPADASIPAGGYLLIFCDDQVDGGVAGGIHVPWKLSSTKGDEVHLVSPDGQEVDATSFNAYLAAGTSWGRLPDGSGPFKGLAPTPGAPNR